ncbi:MAG: hypothetical protein GDA51_11885 [Ekhidna sp.]|nr:hypothetical protein [Ekhidna sp.]
MSIKDQLSYSFGRKDQEPNKRLAREIVEQNDQKKIKELISVFDSRPHVEIQRDCSITLA